MKTPMTGDVVTVQRVISAPPEVIFDLLADASRHPEIDGSGTVKTVRAGAPRRLSKGETFGMSMQQGFKYSTGNTVIEFEDDRRIAWQTHPPGFLSRILAGRIWRYELKPVEGGTQVSESWDISQDHQRFLLRLGGLPKKTRANMERTLERIDQITTTTAR
jgi:uncharacterized protein YndB with AHSA1/START domain